MSALNAPAVRGDVADIAGTAGAAGRRADLVVFRAGFFTGRLRVDDVCFFLVVWELVSIGAAARVASRSVAKTLPFFTRIIDTLNNSRMQA
jgi:hypothetical protein